MIDKKEEIEFLFKKMMQDFEEISKNDEIYREDIEDLGKFKIQWRICKILGYQILELDNYSYKFGETLDDPDMTFIFRDPDEAIKFLKGEAFDEFGPIPHKEYKGRFRFRYTTGWKIADRGQGKRKVRIQKHLMSARFNKKRTYHPYILSKFPMFRDIRRRALERPEGDKGDFGAYIPINQSLGTFENEILPVKLFKHFFDKASNIVILNKCPCRVNRDCQDHKQDIGCMHLGDDTLKMMITEEKGRVITKEEAFEILKDAVDDGLIPLLGRARGESTGFNVEDTGRFMSMCYCCTCCCVNAKYMTHGSVGNVDKTIFTRMEGITVKVDEDLCVGCGECLEVCKFRGMKMIDGIANVNQNRCLGCGRCENTCPNDAISIIIDENSRVDELIAKLESYVDVTPQ